MILQIFDQEIGEEDANFKSNLWMENLSSMNKTQNA